MSSEIDKLKAKGNESFKAGQLEDAIRYYGDAVKSCSKSKDPNALNTAVACFSNRAMCFLKLEKWSDAVSNAENGLDFLKKSGLKDSKMRSKLNYRLAMAHKGGGEINEALKSLDRAAEFAEPGSKEFGDITTERKGLLWRQKRGEREQKFSMFNSKTERGSGQSRGEFVPIKTVKELPEHLREIDNNQIPPDPEPDTERALKPKSKGTFKPPDVLTNFNFTQLMRSSQSELPEIYEYVFDLDSTVFAKIYRQGGINFDAIDFVVESIIHCYNENIMAVSDWRDRATQLITGLSKCSRFETTKIFTSDSKLSKLKTLDSDLSKNVLDKVF